MDFSSKQRSVITLPVRFWKHSWFIVRWELANANSAQPWAVQFEARSKWDAWTKNKGMSTESAMEKYIELVTALAAKHE